MSAAIIFETDGEVIALRPDEIADEDIISQAVNCKSSITVRIYPTFEAWQKCKRTLTYVKMLDLDKPSDRIAFIGRVSAVADSMDSSGRLMQEITCVSAADYLEDTAHTGNMTATALSSWITSELSYHNGAVDLPRRLACTVTGSAQVKANARYQTRYKMISEVLTGGELLYKATQSGGTTTYTPYYKMEWRERYANDVAYIDVAESFGEEKNTPIVIGENLKDIKIERNTDGGIYTSVMVVGGVNSDGSRSSKTVENAAMKALYGSGRVRLIENTDIRCTAPLYTITYPDGQIDYEETAAFSLMKETLEAFATQEAAKLSDPPVTITLNAVDLARLGLAGYDGFEVGNSHPVVCPPLGLYGEPMRITALKRKLASGQIASITIEKGEKATAKAAGISGYMARLEEANREQPVTETAQTEIAQTKAEEQTDNYVVKEISQEDYDDLPSTSPLKTRGFCIIRDSQTGDSTLMLNGTHISSGGGGGGGTIEYAAILSEEQMSEWAPDHELTPLWFRGTATVFYGQAPARFVVQNNRVLWGPTGPIDEDITEQITLEYANGRENTYIAFISAYSVANSGNVSVTVSVAAYDDNGNYLATLSNTSSTVTITPPFSSLKIGMVLKCSSWSTGSDGKLYPNVSGFSKYVSVDGTIYSAGSSNVGSGSVYGIANPVPCTDAERDFALALTTRTEPIS